MAVSEIRKQVDASLKKIDEMIEAIKTEREKITEDLRLRMEKLQLGQFDRQQLEEFFEEPYVIIPTRRPDQWYVIAPKWINFQIGWLDRSTKGYNIFIVNKYVKWFAEIPKALQYKFRFREPLPYKVVDGMLWTGKDLQDQAWAQYRKNLSRREGEDRIRIKKGAEFRLIAQMIEDGMLPFLPKPIDEEDLREGQFSDEWHKMIMEDKWEKGKCGLRTYQNEGWETFLKTGATGIFWAFGAGKSLFGVYAFGRIKGKKLVVVPSIMLKEQWLERIEKYLPAYKNEIEVQTYHSYHKVKDKEYSLIEFDECQHLPATTFIRLATLRAKYRMGFSGSPYREDGRENYIIALTGFPIGMAWEELLRLQVVKEPIFRLYILKNNNEKLRKLDDLLKIPMKTIIFSDWIKFGKTISKRFGVPFIYSETKDRLDLIRDSQVCVVSRVGDEGISLPDIERVIEAGFLYGSRMQESQRFGRLMHALKEEPQHVILMTEKEFEAYQKRLYAIHERGFRIEYIR